MAMIILVMSALAAWLWTMDGERTLRRYLWVVALFEALLTSVAYLITGA